MCYTLCQNKLFTTQSICAVNVFLVKKTIHLKILPFTVAYFTNYHKYSNNYASCLRTAIRLLYGQSNKQKINLFGNKAEAQQELILYTAMYLLRHVPGEV